MAVLLVATTCPTCGSVRVSVVRRAGESEEDHVSPPEPVIVSLESARRQDARIIYVMDDDESLYGDLKIEVISSGRPVIIDGLLTLSQ